jgi:predicted phosphodiesterase
MKRRHFLQAMALTTLPVATSTILAAENKTQNTTNSATSGTDWLLAGPTLQSPTETSVSIVWMTHQNCACHIEFGTDKKLGQKAHASTDGLIDANSRVHRVTLPALKPDTAYYYRIVARPILQFQAYEVEYGRTQTSEVYRFKTLSNTAKKIRFACLNDVHNNIPVLRRLMDVVGDKPEMFFLNGDIVNDPPSEELIVAKFLGPYGELFAHERPFVYVRGNHETRGAFARMLKNYLALPDDKYYFSFDHGPVHFTILDTGEDKADSNEEYSGLVDFDAYREVQRQWLREEVETPAFKNAPFRVLMTHMPFFGSSCGGYGPTACRKSWADILNDAHIDMHFCGHTHRPTIVEPRSRAHDFPIVIGGGPKRDNATVIMAQATESTLTADILDINGKKLQSVSVDRK